MRRLTAVLILLLLGATLASFALAPGRGWWLPENVSRFGERIDALFLEILWVAAVFLVLTLGLLAWAVWHARPEGPPRPRHGNLRLEVLWTVVPGAILVYLAISQFDTWAALRYSARRPAGPVHARVVASQFDWHFVYPGRDGRLGTRDDLDAPYELVVPEGVDVVLELVARDVIHSFFLPALRVKQDVVPGLPTEVWFRATARGRFELACAELCGFGHYKMAGSLRVVSPEDCARYLDELEAEQRWNGSAR